MLMVDLGQKKVDSYPPFFMLCFEIKTDQVKKLWDFSVMQKLLLV
jgi:hypothetical protein